MAKYLRVAPTSPNETGATWFKTQLVDARKTADEGDFEVRKTVHEANFEIGKAGHVLPLSAGVGEGRNLFDLEISKT